MTEAAETRVAGHFGEWLQGRIGPGGPVALVTLPCPALAVRVTGPAGEGAFALDQSVPILEAPTISRLIAALDLSPRGRFRLDADMPPGAGAGASTAALVALARALGGDEDRLIAATLAAEGASDPLMQTCPDTHLWASRAGESLARLPAPPAFEILGGTWGPPSRTDPADADFPDIADLVPLWRQAAEAGDHPALAALASRSASRTGAHRGPEDDPTPDLATRLSALGWARAHTGSARALIYAPGTLPAHAAQTLRDAGYGSVLRFTTGGPA